MRWIILAIRLNNNTKAMKTPPISLKIKDISKSKMIKKRMPKMIVFHFFTIYLKREKFPIGYRFSFQKIMTNRIKATMLTTKEIIAKAINISNFNPFSNRLSHQLRWINYTKNR